MPEDTRSITITQELRSSNWSSATVREFLTDAAKSIGIGTNTDAGWIPPAPAGTKPITMTGGIPDAGTLPTRELMDAIAKVLGSTAEDALRYGGTQGYDGLREALAERATRVEGLPQTAENFVLTNGSAGGIDMIAAAFINPGDVVVVEAPTFSGTLRTFRGHMARLVPVPMDGEGMDTDALAGILESLQHAGTPAKAIYTIPNFHNPTGTYMSPDRRRALVELADRYRALIIEDNAYEEIRFENERLPSLYTLAEGQGVLRACTFSKTIATGLRVGWVEGRPDFVDACVRMRFDMGGSPLLHRALGEYVASGQWEAHIDEMRRLYAEKCHALASTLVEECEAYARFQRPQGGFFLWLECRDGIDAARVAQLAAEEGAMVVPGRNFFMGDGGASHLRLAFSTASPEELREGARRLARAFARAVDSGVA